MYISDEDKTIEISKLKIGTIYSAIDTNHPKVNVSSSEIIQLLNP